MSAGNTTEIRLSEFRITQLEEEVKEMKNTMYGEDGILSSTAVIKQTVQDIKHGIDKKDNKEWVIISGIILCIITTIIANFFGG